MWVIFRNDTIKPAGIAFSKTHSAKKYWCFAILQPVLIFGLFWLKASDFFAEKLKYQNFDRRNLLYRLQGPTYPKMSHVCNLVMSCYIFRDFSQNPDFHHYNADFSAKIIHISLIFFSFCVFTYYF